MTLKQRPPRVAHRRAPSDKPDQHPPEENSSGSQFHQVPVITFRCRKRVLESLERRVEALRKRSFCGGQSQSVMARHRARCSAGRRHDRLTTVAGLVIGFIGCFLLAAIVSSPCVQAAASEDRVSVVLASPSVLSANYYKAIQSDVDGQDEDGADGGSDVAGVVGSEEEEEEEEFDLRRLPEDRDFVEVRRSKSAGASDNKVDDDNEQLAAAAKSVRTTQRLLLSGPENVILPKFGDRISPRKLKKSSAPSLTLASQQQHSDYYAAEAGPVVNGRDGRGVAVAVVHPTEISPPPTISESSPAAASHIGNNQPKPTTTTNPISDSVANSRVNEHIVEGANTPRTAAVRLASNINNSNNNYNNNISPELGLRSLHEVDAMPVLLNENQVNNQNVSSAQAHRLEMSTEFFVVPSVSTPLPLRTKTTTRRPNGSMLVLAKDGKKASYGSGRGGASVTPPTIVAASTVPLSGLRREPWVVPVLVLATLSMFMMAAFEVFVLCKAWRTSPSRRHLFLGQMLLLGLFSCAGLAAILTATPTLLSCATVRFGAGVAFALVFASLLVKCVFLISLNGGVYLPAPYQGLLLLFAVLIQIAVGSQWLLTSPPAVDTVSASFPSSHSIIVNRNASLLLPPSSLVNNDKNASYLDVTSFAVPTIALCRTQFSELLLSLIYVVFLILFVAVLAIKSRGIRDNYREATYIGLAIGGSIPIWLGWTLCGLAVAERHRDACLAFGLIATSTTVFLVMFMPKGRQLAAMGKEGLYVEDREERFSSLSRAGSGYSPSFFHFKPIKYGVMGNGNSPSNTNPSGMGLGSNHNNNISNNLTAGIGNGNSNHNSSSNNGNSSSMTKHQAVATLGGGEFITTSGRYFGFWTTRYYTFTFAIHSHPFP